MLKVNAIKNKGNDFMNKNNTFLIILGVILAMLLSALDQTIVSTALPQIVRELNGLSHLSWVFTAYMLASTITVPIYGKLSDIFGRRNLFLIGIIIFLAGSVLSGISQSMLQLILFRAIQGIGGGAIMVCSIIVIGDIFPPAQRGKWQGIIGAVFGLASIAGPLLGGWITDSFSWRWIFYINIPLGFLALTVLASTIPKIAKSNKKRSVDYIGATLLILGLVPFLLALVWGGNEFSWSSMQIVTLLSFGIISLIGFFLTEVRAKDPILSFELFKNQVFTVSSFVIFLTSMGMFGAILYVPLFAQGVVGISATHSGLVLAPMMISLVISSALTGQFISKTGKYKKIAILGVFFVILGMVLFSRVGINTTKESLILNMIILGAGLGSTMPIFTVAVQSAFGHDKLGQVTAATQLFRSIGGTVGTAMLGGIMNNQLASRLSNFQNDAFVKTITKSKIDMNFLQGFLVHNKSVPQFMQSAVSDKFNQFIYSIKSAFGQSVGHLFLISALVISFAFIAVFFLPEIPLRKTNKPILEKVGADLEAELGHINESGQPEV